VSLYEPCTQSAAEISGTALNKSDLLAVEAVDMFLSIVGAEAGAMALRCLAKGVALVTVLENPFVVGV
jgi:glucokinase